MQRGSMPKPGERALKAFDGLLPDAPGVTIRPMFGNRSAFVNGNMFAGLFGDRLFVRLDASGQDAVMAEGGSAFEPMPGHAMKGYVCLPEGWLENETATRKRIAEALDFTSRMPPKKK
jgi:TfoX/Sxy family transcriptional regulator of competence genes